MQRKGPQETKPLIKDAIEDYLRSDLSATEVASKYGIGRMTLFRHLRKARGDTYGARKLTQERRIRALPSVNPGQPPKPELCDLYIYRCPARLRQKLHERAIHEHLTLRALVLGALADRVGWTEGF